MNVQAEKHLAKAADYFVRGEQFYRKAVKEIQAAQEADPTLSYREIGDFIGRRIRGEAYSSRWVGDVVRWGTSEESTRPPTPWTGERPTAELNRMATKKVLREAPMEQVERIISELPPERQQQVAAAAGHSYHKARVEHDGRERDLSPRERQEREAGKQQTRELAGALLQPLSVMAIEDHLDQAREDLNELVADHSVTTEGLEKIIRSWMAFTTELRVAAAMVDVDLDLEGAFR